MAYPAIACVPAAAAPWPPVEYTEVHYQCDYLHPCNIFTIRAIAVPAWSCPAAGRRPAGAAALPDPVVVKIDTAAGGLGRIKEQRVAVTHEVREGVGRARGTSDGHPGLAVEAIGKPSQLRRPWYAVNLATDFVFAEAGVVRRGLEYAVDLEVNGFA